MLPILLDLHYKFSTNHFEEFYGDSVTYSSIEQESYIDLKEMSFEQISRGIKFRKFGRLGNILTIKMDISSSDYELFLSIFREDEFEDPITGEIKKRKFNFLHDFKISNIRDLTMEEKIKFKKTFDPMDEDSDEAEEVDELEDIIDDGELDIIIEKENEDEDDDEY